MCPSPNTNHSSLPIIGVHLMFVNEWERKRKKWIIASFLSLLQILISPEVIKHVNQTAVQLESACLKVMLLYGARQTTDDRMLSCGKWLAQPSSRGRCTELIVRLLAWLLQQHELLWKWPLKVSSLSTMPELIREDSLGFKTISCQDCVSAEP